MPAIQNGKLKYFWMATNLITSVNQSKIEELYGKFRSPIQPRQQKGAGQIEKKERYEETGSDVRGEMGADDNAGQPRHRGPNISDDADDQRGFLA